MPGWKRTRSTPVAQAEYVAGYRDLHRIGHGGFSVVYRAYREDLDRVVALKVLSAEFVDAQVKRRFLREVRLTGRLSGHPNVVTVLDSGLTSTGRPYIAMDLYEQGSLRDRLLASGPLPVPEVLRVGVKIAGALAAAHDDGIVHRDVKPQNILVSRYAEPALADFGTARLTAELDASATSEALTPFHAAPEVLEGHPPTPASDVYSLGSTLYQLLAGRAAFQRSGDFGIAPLLLRILSEQPPPLPNVPGAVESVIRRAMDRAVEGRYHSAAELLIALQQVQRDLGLSVTEVPNGPSPSPPPAPGPTTPAMPAAAPVVELAGPVAALPAIAPTDWEFGEKTGYRTGVPPAAVAGSAAPVPPVAVGHDSVAAGCGAAGREDDARTGRPLMAAAAGAGVLALAAIAIPLALTSGHHRAPSPGTSASPTTAQAAGHQDTAPPVTPAPPDAAAQRAAPVRLTVAVAGPTATLRWKLAPGNNFPLIVDAPSLGIPPTPLKPGTTSYTEVGLQPGTEYCFKVGAVTADSSQAVTIKWSNVACVR